MTVSASSVADLIREFPRERTWLLPALLAVQRARGHLSADALDGVAAHLRVPASEVWGVATHYPELRLTPTGRRLVRVCTGVSCRVAGSLDVLGACESRLGVRAGATTGDGAITLEEMDCAFQCAVAPVVEVDHRCHGRVAPGRLDAVLADAPPARARPAASPRAAPPPLATGSPAARVAAMRRAIEARPASTRVAVALGTCGLATGAAATRDALVEEVARRGLPLTVVGVGCNGMCWASPLVVLHREDLPFATLVHVEPAAVPALLDALAAGTATTTAAAAEVTRGQRRVLLERCGVVDPGDIADALRLGAYGALARALDDGRPERVIEEVRLAGLHGRGGAYFQTAVKWAACRAAPGTPKFVVLNGEEGEPGIFKDRHLMEGDPHAVLEGVLLAAFAVGASRAILYVHGEAALAAERLGAAVEDARRSGLLGPDVLGSGFALDVELRRGAGGFVLGEETALLESIEGRRAMPRTRPPFPVESGLFGRPTVINNVETLCAVPRIVERGGAWYAGLGRGHGTKLFGLSGHVHRPGVVEMEIGCTLRELLEEVGGGSVTGRPIRAAVVGGPSGSVVPPRQFDEPLIPRGPVNPGTGGVIALDERASVRDAVRTLLAFNTRESCGKCTPCREGTARLLALLEGPLGLAQVKALAEVIQVASLCGLGQAAPSAVLSGLSEFPDDFGRVS
jgi:NADH:ubiquinone oxidoreductase subunit F (NADH-binding)/NADH:ubiquinone oxidoreductase subunit E